MDDLEINPLYKAFLTKFRREFEIACEMSHLITIPISDSLNDISINQFFANSHILMPSKLLRMHYTSIQAGCSEHIEFDGKHFTCHLDKKKNGEKIVAKVLAEEIGYNSFNKEYRILLVDRPLIELDKRPFIKSILYPLVSSPPIRTKLPRSLTNHDDCLKYLECLSHDILSALEKDVRRFQTNYIILYRYLDDAAKRIKDLIDDYVMKFELHLKTNEKNSFCDTIQRSIRLSVENYVIHLLHGKLMAAIHNSYRNDDKNLMRKFNGIFESNLNVCQLGAQKAFSDLILTNELIMEINKLSTVQSPLAIVTSLITVVDLIKDSLDRSLKFKHMMGHDIKGTVSICSDDLIAIFVYLLAQIRPSHLYSLMKYLEMFGWTSIERDQAAYYAATFQVVIQYVFSYSDSILKSRDNNAEITSSQNIEIKLKPCELNRANDFLNSIESYNSSPTDPSNSNISLRANPNVDIDWEFI